MTSSSPAPEELADKFFSVAQALKRLVNARVQHTGLSMARLRVLFHLIEGEGVRIGELSHCVDVVPRTMTQTVAVMERDGLVERRPDPTDGRATIVSITDEGRRSFAEGMRSQARAVSDVFDGLDADQRVALVEVLDRLGDAVATASGSPAVGALPGSAQVVAGSEP